MIFPYYDDLNMWLSAFSRCWRNVNISCISGCWHYPWFDHTKMDIISLLSFNPTNTSLNDVYYSVCPSLQVPFTQKHNFRSFRIQNIISMSRKYSEVLILLHSWVMIKNGIKLFNNLLVDFPGDFTNTSGRWLSV